MAKNNIGGFFVELGLLPDKNSFEVGNKLIGGMTDSFSKLIGTARNAAGVLVTTAVASGAIASQEYKTAQILGMSAEKLEKWKTAAKIAGTNANSLVGSIGQLSNVMNHLDINGQGLKQYAEQLGELGLGFDQLEGMDPGDAYAEIIRKAQEQYDSNPLRVTTIVGDILGSAGQDFFIELQRQNKSIDDFLIGANKLTLATEEDIEKGAEFAAEVRTLKTSIENITKYLGLQVGDELTPYLKQINDFIQENLSAIRTTIDLIGEAIGSIVELITPIATLFMSYAEDSTGSLSGLMGSIKEGNWKGAGKELKDRWDKTKSYIFALQGNPLGIINAAIDVSQRLKKNKDKENGEMDDGIMRPDGTITQVAPDDWVFAARNVSDLAKAFIPQNGAGAGAPSVYTINQTFNIGATKDMPQVIRQQAYNGAREGLLQSMAQSSQRLQMMSGTR